ncbi:AAA family ATPase [Pararhizobium mangrovi]|uniref:DNA primase n=1 Tax=Pararhizobium mangrovi TaxID=2590452 RepID=A0A506TZ64_9HYPH|nr:toprim domain-containing protein [Pararhizobium mangrovi]TPW26015.1 DNA primase [Pararhizobium mangrovi]
MADIVEIKRMLADRAQAVAEMLLPGGRKESQEWRAGSTAGEKGQSLGVHLSGPKAGIWQDFATDEGGDLLDLWMAVKGGTLLDALKDASSYLGVTHPEPFKEPSKSYQRPKRPDCRKPEAKVHDYLTVDRNLPGYVLDAYKIGERGDEILFPFILPDGVLALAKARKAEAKASPKPTAGNCEPILFGWQAVPANAREIIITEGEIDAMSWAAYGHAAMSVPFGGGKGAKQQWIENEFDRLARFETIYLSMDMDPTGEEAVAEIVSRLGRHRCRVVALPLKDANDCLVEGVTQAEMDDALRTAKTMDPEGLRRASDYHDKVVHLFWPAHEEREGFSTPYSKLIGRLHFRPAEMTLWSGASGSGKSQMISDCVPHWVREGSRVCVASLEMKGEQTLRRMVKQTGGVDRPTEPFIRQCLNYLDPGLLIYERVGKAGVQALLEVFEYARAKYACDQFVIDSLMRMGVASDDYVGQEKAVFQIVDWAVEKAVHVHLVAHARKGEKGGGAPSLEDVKGASEIGSNAFNILTIWRDRQREEDIRKGGEGADESDKPGVIVNVAKQRNGDFEGKVGLWFDQDTYQYQSTPDKAQWRRSFIGRGQQERVA